ncbi:MFS transporter [Dehalococcoidia bacterium]|nr:MFS transporter [Dehalococcoidia bacterium]
MKYSRIYYGWWIVASYFVMNFYWGGTLMAGMTALFNPMRDTFGLSATATTLAISLRFLIAIATSPWVGYVFDRVGPRPLIWVAILCATVGMSMVAAANSTTLFFLAFFIASVGIAIFLAGTGPAAAAVWFTRHRGVAISILIAGAGVGSFLVPVVVWLEDQWGWRTALTIIVIGLLVVCLPMSMLLRHRPESYGLRPDGDKPAIQSENSPPLEQPKVAEPTFGEAMRSPTFWLYSGSISLAALGGSSAILFIIPHLSDAGFSKTASALAVTALGIIGVISLVSFGWLSDHFDKRILVGFSFLCQGAGIAILAFASSTWHLIPFAVIFGMGSRAVVPIVSSLLADYYGTANFGKVQGVMYSMFTAGSALGPILGAIVKDTTGSFTPIFVVYSTVTLVALMAITVAKVPHRAYEVAPRL